MHTSTLVKPEQLRLYLVTDDNLCLGKPLHEVVEAAVRGGVTCVQLREKKLATHDFVARAIALKTLLAPLRIPLVINDRLDIALACEADGVHLGQSDMPVETARRLLPAHVFMGWSVESPEDVRRAASLPVDYLGVSPVFATPTKTDTHTPWGLEGLRQVRTQTTLPLVAIGGIHDGNAADVVQAGADGLAVVSAICSAEDPKLAAEKLLSIAAQHFTKASP
jgi:thiamine-phosphate pyrophosphorylase